MIFVKYKSIAIIYLIEFLYFYYYYKMLYSGRYVCWTAYLLRYHGKTGHVEPVPLPGAPFSHYYATDATDEGIIMETDISVKEVSSRALAV